MCQGTGDRVTLVRSCEAISSPWPLPTKFLAARCSIRRFERWQFRAVRYR